MTQDGDQHETAHAQPPPQSPPPRPDGMRSCRSEREGRRGTRDEGRHTTRTQPHEQLLVGWNAGGMTTTRATRRGGYANDTPPAPSPTSHCPWGGSRVGRRMTTNDRRRGTTTNDGDNTTTRPSLTSHCSWGGSRVEGRPTMRRRDTTGGRGIGDDHNAGTTSPPPTMHPWCHAMDPGPKGVNTSDVYVGAKEVCHGQDGVLFILLWW
jgi:hypothetical protein